MPAHSASVLRLAGLAALLCGASACHKPEPPADDKPPQPQATELRDAIKQPIDKAKAVEGAVQQAAADQSRQIDAATTQ